MTGFKYEGSDVKKISEQLLGLADLLDGRPPSEKALLLWLSCLEDEVPAWAAISALTDWPKRHSKMPAPADIVKTAREIRERALEKKTHQASASEISVAEVRPADPAIARAVDRSLKAIRDLGARPERLLGVGGDHRDCRGSSAFWDKAALPRDSVRGEARGSCLPQIHHGQSPVEALP